MTLHGHEFDMVLTTKPLIDQGCGGSADVILCAVPVRSWHEGATVTIRGVPNTPAQLAAARRECEALMFNHMCREIPPSPWLQ
jgi:hypothetical protein